MKKLDKLILSAFIGPFIITFVVVVFILFNINMLKYFDDLIGKGLEWSVIGEFFLYFSIFTIPTAMPLAVLLSSLIAYGNLGEHFELTAVKSAGISLTRTLVPIFFFVVALTGVAFYVNNNLVPKAALEAYSLLYDIKQKKPALDLREGAFYNGIPDMSIKVNKKFPDGITIKDVLIYDHRKHDGNRDVTIADSGRMYTIMQERYLKLELFNGYNYTEGASSEQEMSGRKRAGSSETLSRSQFAKTQVVFDLSSFQLETTDKKLFQGNRLMRNLNELETDMDSLDLDIKESRYHHHLFRSAMFQYYGAGSEVNLPEDLKNYKPLNNNLITDNVFPVAATIPEKNRQSDTLRTDSASSKPTDTLQRTKPKADSSRKAIAERNKRVEKKPGVKRNLKERKLVPENKIVVKPVVLTDSAIQAKVDSVFNRPTNQGLYDNAANKVRTVKSNLSGTASEIKSYNTDRKVFQIQWHKIIASSFACIAMFLIGAPLGAIIKKGGLGVPFLVSILFFIVYYIFTMTGEKWAKQGIIPVPMGVWAADLILFIIGLYFLRQARLDARFFEADFYLIQIDKAKKWLTQRGLLPKKAS